MTMLDQKCEVCLGESCQGVLGVASIPGVPMSIAWGKNCLEIGAIPPWVFDVDYDTANGKLEAFVPEALERQTWFNGKYMTMIEYVKERIK